MSSGPVRPEGDPDLVQCPTCRASQPWADSCRRCKSDLRLLREFMKAYEHNRRDCLEAILDGDALAATRFANLCHALRPGAASRRLLALAAFLREDWTAAAALAIHES